MANAETEQAPRCPDGSGTDWRSLQHGACSERYSWLAHSVRLAQGAGGGVQQGGTCRAQTRGNAGSHRAGPAVGKTPQLRARPSDSRGFHCHRLSGRREETLKSRLRPQPLTPLISTKPENRRRQSASTDRDGARLPFKHGAGVRWFASPSIPACIFRRGLV